MKLEATDGDASLRCNGSIVVYNTPLGILGRAVESFLRAPNAGVLYIVDHSPTEQLRQNIESWPVQYIHNPANPGYGAGHNVALRQSTKTAPFHVVLNPDVYFDDDVLSYLATRMLSDPTIGMLMPKVLYPNGRIQYLCKLLPTPADLFSECLPHSLEGRRLAMPYTNCVLPTTTLKWRSRTSQDASCS